MKERGILFSAPMIRALLAGTKTQTRRIVKPQQPKPSTMEPYELEMTARDGSIVAFTMDQFVASRHNRYGLPGDRLWVKETFYCDDYRYPDGPRKDLLDSMEYRASHDCRNWEAGCPCADDAGRSCWRSPLHMPRWASRISLEITGVRVERLQDITEADAQAEGVDGPANGSWPAGFGSWSHKGQQIHGRPWAHRFLQLWMQINGHESAHANPWVWVVEFRHIDADVARAVAAQFA